MVFPLTAFHGNELLELIIVVTRGEFALNVHMGGDTASKGIFALVESVKAAAV